MPRPRLKKKTPQKVNIRGPYLSTRGPMANARIPPQKEPKAIAPVTDARDQPSSSTIGFMKIDRMFW